jgi:hypothetical protein
MSRDYSEHARVTAICVNLALDTVETDIQIELATALPSTAAVLERLLTRLKERRLNRTEQNVDSPRIM